MRRLISIVCAAAVATSAAVVLALPAHAAATPYTWTGKGTDHTYWTNPLNWAPNGVPTNGDSVTVGSLTGGPSNITLIPTVSLSSLTLNETGNNIYLDGAPTSTLTVTGHLSWVGGDISVPVTIAAGATGTILGSSVAAHVDAFGGGFGGAAPVKRLTVKGSLDIVGIGIDLNLPALRLVGGDDVVVAAGGTLSTSAGTLIQSQSCCVDHTATLQNFGTITTAGALLMMYMGLDQNGVFRIANGTRTQFVSGPIRSQGSAVAFSGGGVFEVISTGGGNYDPAHPAAPEQGWKLGASGTTAAPATLTLRDGTAVELDKSAYLVGVGTITGVGTLVLSGGHIRARVTVNVPLRTTTTTSATMDKTSHVDSWTSGIIGEHGQVTVAKTAVLATGSFLQVEAFDTVTLVSGASLTVPGGAGITSSGCCVNPPKVTFNTGSTVTVGSTTGTALLKWIAFGGSGHLVLAGPSQWNGLPSVVLGGTITGHGLVTGNFSTYHATFTPGAGFPVHGAASLTGTLVTNTAIAATGAVTLAGTLKSSSGTGTKITGSSLTGHFACAYTPGRIPIYTATSMALSGIGVTDPGCLVYATGTRLSARYTGTKAFSVSLPSTAKRALLRVTVSGATVATSLKITATGGGTVSLAVPKGTSALKYVIIAISSTRTLSARLAAGTASVTIAQYGSYH